MSVLPDLSKSDLGRLAVLAQKIVSNSIIVRSWNKPSKPTRNWISRKKHEREVVEKFSLSTWFTPDTIQKQMPVIPRVIHAMTAKNDDVGESVVAVIVVGEVIRYGKRERERDFDM